MATATTIDVPRILEESVPLFALLVGLWIGHRSNAKLAAAQRYEDQLQRWKERRQDLLLRLMDHMYSLAHGASTAVTMTARPELRGGEYVDRSAPWMERWLDDRKETYNLKEIIGDPELEKLVDAFLSVEQEVAHSKVPKEELSATILMLEEPLGRATARAAALYRELEGPPPTKPRSSWWNPL